MDRAADELTRAYAGGERETFESEEPKYLARGRTPTHARRRPVRGGLDAVEESLGKALAALKAGDTAVAACEIERARQTLGEDIRDALGLYDWNREAR